MVLRYFSALFFVITAALFAEASPLQELKHTVTSVLKILDSQKSIQTKRTEITKIFYQTFDIERLGANTLKSDYKALSKEEKALFNKTFSEFVLEFYLEKIDRYSHNKVEYLKEEIKGSRAIVYTHFEYQGKFASLNYSMVQKGGKWLIYDFEIEGVRLSTTYRSQFARVLKRRQFDGLMVELNKLISRYRK